MGNKQYPASRGKRTVYAEHGVWYDPATKHIHVAMGGGSNDLVKSHLSYARGTKEYAVYEKLLAAHGRAPGQIDVADDETPSESVTS